MVVAANNHMINPYKIQNKDKKLFNYKTILLQHETN